MTNTMIVLPKKLEAILQKDQRLHTMFLGIIAPFSDILTENKLFFFSEYTDHGIKHIENTLQYTENLIAEDTFLHLTAKEAGVILLSTVLHDIGMHTNAEMFKNMIEGKYDNLVGLFPEEKTWKRLWKDFLYDSQYWGDEKKKNVFGNPDYNIRTPNLSDLQSLTDYDKKLIGEFIRINHCRIAQEIALNGYLGKNALRFGCDDEDSSCFIDMAGIVARSHGMDVRDTYDYLEKHFGDTHITFGVHVVYLMVLLRLADYLQIDNSRTNPTMSYIDTFYSPYSVQEHKTHRSIINVEFSDADKERILVQANPQNALTYVKIERLVDDIQKEFDLSWAILGEVYTNNNYKLRYRRITSNISNERFKKGLKYVPQQFEFSYNNALFKLLITPLYGNDPTYGVRELVQNAVDACRLCINELQDNDEPHVIVEVDSNKKLFTITDKGKGMNLYEIKNYFLTIGSSFNDNINWKRTRDQNHLFRTGRFGIGVLAAFLLGPEIVVVTKKRGENEGYRFSASLGNKFIQIDRVDDVEYGTKIEINCNLDCILELSRDDRWYNWYIGSMPRVVYYYNGIQKKKNIDLRGYQQLKLSSDNFGVVYWKPIDLNHCFDTREQQFLFCNEFLVSRFSSKKQFVGSDIKNLGLSFPSIQIEDTYNLLPLNLRRNGIDSKVKLSFEQELARELFVDTMCQLMAANNQTLNRYVSSHVMIIHEDGFSLNFRYYNEHIKEDMSVVISDISSYNHPKDKTVFSNTLKGSNHFIQFTKATLNTDIVYRKGLGRLKLLNQKRVYSLEEQWSIFHAYFSNMYFAIPENTTNASLLLLFDKILHVFHGWLILAPTNYISIFESLVLKHVTSPQITQGNIIAIWEREVEKMEKTTSIVDDLFLKYMNNDPVVPFEMEERKKKFPLLFHDYGDVINHYIQKPFN